MQRALLFLATMLCVSGVFAQITETEPNNDSSSANTITRGTAPWADTGSLLLDPAGDNDWFIIHLDGGDILTVQTTPLSGTAPDTVVAIIDASGATVLVVDDDGGPGLGSLVNYQACVSQDVYVAVAGYHGGGYTDPSYFTGTHTVSGNYQIDVSINNDPCSGAGIWHETVDGGGDSGDLPDTAQSVSRNDSTPCETAVTEIRGTLDLNDADMYRICVTDAFAFSATTVGLNTFDSQLWLFNEDGTGIAHNDDDPGGSGLQSTLTGQYLPGPGTYLLAVSRYNRDPFDASGNLIWNNTPFAAERQPDGPGAANPVASWAGTTSATNYRIGLTGAYFTGEGGEVPGDVNGDGCVDDADLANVIFEFGGAESGLFGNTDINDDGVVDDADLAEVIFNFGQGCV